MAPRDVRLLLLIVRGQVGRAAQAFVVAAVPGRAGRHQLLVFRRRLHRLVQRLQGRPCSAASMVSRQI